jgi:eukaryotic-like serine/threonine-protein kinase
VTVEDYQLNPLRRIGQVVAGRYRIIALIGQGGMGSVYRAVHVSLQEPVVVKFVHAILASDPHVRERFRREAKALVRLRHPGIVTIHDFGEDQNEPYIALELLEGRTLADIIVGNPPPSLLDIFTIFDQILDVLASAHAAGVIHRDMKPDNVMVLYANDGSLRVKVLDFGIAHIEEEEMGDTKLTTTGTVVGTPSFMSPEQCRGIEVVPESDVYGVAVMLFLAITRNLPFAGGTAAETFAQHLYVNPPTLASRGAPADLPPGLETLVARGLAKNAAERPSAQEFREALQAIATGESVEARDALAARARQSMAAQSRKERAAGLLATGATAPQQAFEVTPQSVEGSPTVLLWGFTAARATKLQDAFAVNGINAIEIPRGEGAGGGLTAPKIDERCMAVVVSGEEWAPRLEALPSGPKRPPVFVIDVSAASEIAALVRAGASDVALSTVPIDMLASKLRRLIRRGVKS